LIGKPSAVHWWQRAWICRQEDARIEMNRQVESFVSRELALDGYAWNIVRVERADKGQQREKNSMQHLDSAVKGRITQFTLVFEDVFQIESVDA
jgi:hypothetical protein